MHKSFQLNETTYEQIYIHNELLGSTYSFITFIHSVKGLEPNVSQTILEIETSRLNNMAVDLKKLTI